MNMTTLVKTPLKQLAGWVTGKERAVRLCQAVVDAKLTYLGMKQLLDLHDRVREMDRRQVPGILVEAGCALGGSAIVMAAAKRLTRPLLIHDVFGLIPAPGPRDGDHARQRYREIQGGQATGLGGDTYYGYQPDLIGRIHAAFEQFDLPTGRHRVQLVQGLFQNTMNFDQPIAMAHIDCDWYDSVTVCLERIVPRLSPDGVLVIDDYDYYESCRRAVDDYFATRTDQFTMVRRSRLHIEHRGPACSASAA